MALVSFSGTRPCHLTPATEWAQIPCPLGRKLKPANRNSKEECMQIKTAKGNGCPQCLCGGQMKMAPASLTDTHLEDNSTIKSSYEFPFWISRLWNNCCFWYSHERLSSNSNSSLRKTKYSYHLDTLCVVQDCCISTTRHITHMRLCKMPSLNMPNIYDIQGYYQFCYSMKSSVSVDRSGRRGEQQKRGKEGAVVVKSEY